jgi:hypothetical protein
MWPTSFGLFAYLDFGPYPLFFFLSLSWVLSFYEVWHDFTIKCFETTFISIYDMFTLQAFANICGFGKIVFEHNKTRRKIEIVMRFCFKASGMLPYT